MDSSKQKTGHGYKKNYTLKCFDACVFVGGEKQLKKTNNNTYTILSFFCVNIGHIYKKKKKPDKDAFVKMAEDTLFSCI